jgi:hypothetical protein
MRSEEARSFKFSASAETYSEKFSRAGGVTGSL